MAAIKTATELRIGETVRHINGDTAMKVIGVSDVNNEVVLVRFVKKDGRKYSRNMARTEEYVLLEGWREGALS